jgi:hypothetical protein
LIINIINYLKKRIFFKSLTPKLIRAFREKQAKNDFFFIFFFTILLEENTTPEKLPIDLKLNQIPVCTKKFGTIA